MKTAVTMQQDGKPSPSMRVKGVLFDFDGTLTRPGLLDFAIIKKAMQCPADTAILEYIASLPPGKRRERCERILESFEAQSAERAEPNADAEDILLFLRSLDMALGIITRNRLCSVLAALRQFKDVAPSDFAAVITRENAAMPKPDPEGVLLAGERMGVPAKNLLVVGDYLFDIEAGRSAGATTVFLDNGTLSPHGALADFTISRLGELKEIITRSGKIADCRKARPPLNR